MHFARGSSQTLGNHMKSISMAIPKPPWANQAATKGQRTILWFLFAFLTIAEAAILYSATIKGSFEIIDQNESRTAFVVLGNLYLCLLFMHIARKGKTPTGWLPR
jgi:hypothetical protein